ncbi:protein kinase [Streptomyces sp. TRM66268-LWL]|uniref:Protein kinase n=1 Tax=Streptomyces polyasparticus TaxID=2767826 RepID=A0ABR7SSF0_9ACTN|nr:protein kinase [Streptomyces polyasparticus]MBC9717233.1 protein kinase [Streptomyces polyasparticus]
MDQEQLTQIQAALGQAGAEPLRSGDPGAIGPYAAIGVLGSGGMGRVYLARPADERPGLAAIKVIRPEYAEDAEFRRRFEREAAVHGKVRTPHAPSLLGTGFEDRLLWMATEYVPGLNLADAVRENGVLEPAGVWRLVGELGRALGELAATGIVHRDLKPSNVILSAQGVHIIDFGISQAVDSSAITSTGSRVGTPAYMAPEYLRDGRCDAISDVFSLACTLVYAATGHAPFGDGTGVDVMHRVAFEEPMAEVIGELTLADASLAALLTACLTKDPALRPSPRQLVAAADAHPRTASWQEPLHGRLVARGRAFEILHRATAQQTGHFRAPTVRAPSPAPQGYGSAQGAGYAPPPGPFGPSTPPGQYGASTPPGQYGASTPPGQYGGPTPPGQHGSPSSAGQLGPHTPPGQYGTSTPPGQYETSTPPGQYGSPSSAGQFGPHTPPGRYGSPGPVVGPYGGGGAPGAGGAPHTRTSAAARTRGKKPLVAAAMALTVAAVAVGAFLLTRSDPADDTLRSAAPSSGPHETAGPGDAGKNPSAKAPEKPGKASPSASGKDEDGAKDTTAGGEGASGISGPGGGEDTEPTAGETVEAGTSGGDASTSTGGGGSDPEPAPTKTAAAPAKPPWIADCTYYSGTTETVYGHQGTRVVQVQCMLTKRGYSVGSAGVDGEFGEDTRTAVKRFQSAKGLDVDGRVGPNTWAALRSWT